MQIKNISYSLLAAMLFAVSRATALDAPPVVQELDPAAESVVTELTFINVTFNEDVTGVDASDLLINGVPAAGMTMVSPIEYDFSFPQPATGTVNVAWASSHGIVDTGLAPDAFAGGSWSYTLDPNAVLPMAIISEFMADNEHGIEDEDGSRGDWIEIYNSGLIDINLGGWFLTDTATNLTKWRFPSVTLPVNRYLLVWASEKNRTNPAAPLHTNFKLEKNGEYLSLANPQRQVVSAFAPAYPAQQSDNSYGRDRVDPNLLGYFVMPTPGVQNATSGTGFAPEPLFSLESGVYTNVSMTLTISAPAGTIRYTLDGSVPTNSSPAYAGPITFSTNMTLKARVFQTGLWPSPVRARAFVLLDQTSRAFSSDLPVLIMSTGGRSIPEGVPPGGVRRTGSLFVFDTFRGRAGLTGKPEFTGLAQFEVFGQTSASIWGPTAKKPYNIEINDELGNDRAVSLLGMPAEADWKMRNPYSDKCLMNDFLAYELFEKMGRYSVRRRLVEVFVDTDGGKLHYPSNYHGVLVLLEKIEVDNDRVNLAELTPAHTNEPAITGGYMIKYDKDSTGDRNIRTPGGPGFTGLGVNDGRLKLHEPKSREITPVQMTYLTNYLAQMEKSLYATNWRTATGTNHYSHYLDVDSFVDQHWIVEFTKQIDGYRLSNFMSKDRGGKLKMEPIWDWNLAFGNADYLQGGITNGWYWQLLGDLDHPWLRRLIAGTSSATGTTGDPDFKQKVADRWGVLRTNVMNGPNVLARIDQLANILKEAAARDWARYPARIGVDIWPNPDGTGDGRDVNYARPTNFIGDATNSIVGQMKKWMLGRYLWIDTNFIRSPVFNHGGGPIAPGLNLAISGPGGNTLYYTLDGTDPRAPGGNVAPQALSYSGPIVISSNARVVARSRGNNFWGWSPPTAATFVTQTPQLVITEIMYHPADPPAGNTNDANNYEFIEVKNTGATSLNLQRFRLSGAVQFDFPSVQLVSGQSGVVAANTAAFQARYGSGPNVIGQYTNQLANEGERIVLEGPVGEPIHDFEYDDDWYRITDGVGFSLVIVNEDAALSTWGLKTSWRPSGVINGSPGEDDSAPASFPSVVINEALTHTDPPQLDAVEIRNLSASAADISGWYLTDDFGRPKKYRFPNGTSIPENGFLTIYETNFNTGPNGFALSSGGDEIYLFSANTEGELTGYFHGFDFGPQFNSVTFGRHVISTGEDHFVAQTSETLTAANANPRVGPVVVSEINYHPVDIQNRYGVFDNDEDEYIELHNASDSPVTLYDPSYPTNRWGLRDAVDFTFPPNTTLAAGGYALVVGFDPADISLLDAFKTRNLVPSGVPIYGPYDGQLDNSSDSVEIIRPDVPNTNGTVSFVLADKVRYSNLTPWPVGADGIGPSLQRSSATGYGNDPANWLAAGRSPGSAYVPGPAPIIVQQPQPQTGIAYDPVMMRVVATGQGPLSYQWRFNGTPIFGATGPDLILPVAEPSQEGLYDVVVMNGGGAVASSQAMLSLRIPIRFTTQPQSVNARPTSNVTFSVAAVSTVPPIRYQWYHNSSLIANATNTSYTISGVGLQHGGSYYVTAVDGIKATNSAIANLLVLVNPLIIVQPLSQDVPYGGTATLSVTVSNSVTFPIGYRWRRSGATVAFSVANDYTSVLNVSGVTNSAAVNFNVVVTNVANTTGILSQNAAVRAIADTDGDGIPDEMEQALGLNANDPDDASTDADGDTMTNLEEYIAGTIHTNAQSYLKVDQISAPGSAILEFSAVSNRTYTVQYTDDVGSGLWSKLSSISARTTNHVGIVVDDNPSPARVYRLATPAQ